MPQQPNGFDCGVWLCAAAAHLVLLETPLSGNSFSRCSSEQMRKCMLLAVLLGYCQCV
jgi:Ulp1 family protease